MVISAAMGALALALPPVFHAVGLGSRFLPMLLPLLLNGFLVPWRWAVVTGFTVPWLSSLAMGMPPILPPLAAVVAAEAAVLGGAAAALYRRGRGRLWVALPAAVVLGRSCTALTTWLLARFFDLPPHLTSASVIVQGLPGVALQFTVVPIVVSRLGRRRGPLFDQEHSRET